MKRRDFLAALSMSAIVTNKVLARNGIVDLKPYEFPITDNETMLFQRIPSGTFKMGSPDKERQKVDGTQHQVEITKPFYIGVYEVTQHQWNRVMGVRSWSTHAHFAGRPENPVEDISWQQTQEFFEKINARNVGFFRLPTEAEWEYSCRAGTTTRCFWGDDPEEKLVDDYAWRGEASDGTSHPVGQKLPNPWGLYDMCGNVVEFCLDRYSPYKTENQIDPHIKTGTQVVARGGDWLHASGVDSETRRTYNDTGGLSFLGFRAVREVDM